ncbi:MAG: TIGR02281 family clan AA aspartic protease [Burkholderiales bacterium]|nr:TIGR02281 family clan AA aspartic protease [Burkholderiales bacterium]
MIRILVGFALALAPALAVATDITVIGLFAGRAVVVVDRGKPRTLRVGESTPEGVKLLAADSESATFEVKGRRQTLGLGRHLGSGAPASPGSVALTADSRGHFITTGTVNGMSTRFMVDTGASVVALSADDAKRAGVNYLAGQRGRVQTANGSMVVHMVKLDAVQVGGIVVNNVDAAVIEGDRLPVALLGMSFLNRMEMKRAGDTLTLIQRY